ncbi:tetratricopeptide repeat protein [Dysgonomonas sp. ZJ709]|uniref:tetratricopeptide repeat protein n=1 Tax=Dysgonomonas sp. ZJ709 TaxID=2709797 RepID=UPI0013E9A0FA|nr:tetratricopeptide repeat protein [Dysgonomonas sp. ZJ709]
MRRIIAIVLFISVSILMSFSQAVQPIKDIKVLFDDEQYQELVDQYAGKPRTLSAQELGYVASAYFKLSDFDNCNRYAGLALQKDANNSLAYNLKGLVYSATGNFKDAVNMFKKAIALSPREAEYYTNLGDSYLGLEQISEAIEIYKKATQQIKPSERAYYMLGVAYTSLDDYESALKAFNVAKSKVVKDKELYVTVIYNIGFIEYTKGEYQKAIPAFKDLIEHFPDDYRSFEKLIQCYYALGDYKAGDSYKSKLYKAHEGGMLNDTELDDKICIDNFIIAGNSIHAYERYQTGDRPYFYLKNMFYVLNPDGKVICEVQLQYSPETNNYGLAKIEDGKIYTYGIFFDSIVSYSTLKSFAKDIINGVLKPTAVTLKE